MSEALKLLLNKTAKFQPSSFRPFDLRSLLSDGIDPAHLVLVGRRLDEVVCVGLSDDFEKVSLDVAFYSCGGERR